MISGLFSVVLCLDRANVGQVCNLSTPRGVIKLSPLYHKACRQVANLSYDGSTKPDHILDELAPEEKEASDGVSEMPIASEADDAAFQVVIDLTAEFAFNL